MNHKHKKPNYEKSRLDALNTKNVLDTLPSEKLDALTAQAQLEFGSTSCLVSLVAEDRQWFKSRQCMTSTETPRTISFCTYAIAEEEYLIVSDAKADKLFANNPLVTGAPFIRAYAGAILRNQDGYELGTFCLLYSEPRQFSNSEIESLKDYARIAESILHTEYPAA